MSDYGRMARYYDAMYERLVDYDGDVRFLEAAFRKFRARPKSILDLGCGTGNHDVRLAKRGYEITGLDLSREQLAIARRKARRSKLAIDFRHGDMADFDLGRTFDAAICMFGAFGYLREEDRVLSCFASLGKHLRRRGMLVYEFWSATGVRPSPHRGWLLTEGRTTIARLDESRYAAETNELSMTFRTFVIRGDRLVDDFVETHVVKTYLVSEMRRLLNRGGFDLVGAYDGTASKGFDAVKPSSFRVMGVARRR